MSDPTIKAFLEAKQAEMLARLRRLDSAAVDSLLEAQRALAAIDDHEPRPGYYSRFVRPLEAIEHYLGERDYMVDRERLADDIWEQGFMYDPANPSSRKGRRSLKDSIRLNLGGYLVSPDEKLIGLPGREYK